MPLLEIRNLYANVDGKEILQGLDLSIDAGEVHAMSCGAEPARRVS